MSSSSVLLIDEKVLPDETPGEVSEYVAGLSLAVLAMFNGVERRENQWHKLLGDGGFEVKRIKKYTDLGDSVILAVPKDGPSYKL